MADFDLDTPLIEFISEYQKSFEYSADAYIQHHGTISNTTAPEQHPL